MTIGKKEIKTTMMIFGVMPNPNQMMRTGAMARIGTAWELITRGSDARLRVADSDMPTPMSKPDTTATR